MVQIKALFLSCPQRAAVLAQTLVSFRDTDWHEEPGVILDDGSGMIDNSYRLLSEAAKQEWDYLLFLEDDLLFNRHLHHNLVNWLPVKYGYANLATLYQGGTTTLAGPHFATGRAVEHGGSQALLISRRVLEEILSGYYSSWTTEFQDVRICGCVSRIDPTIYIYHPHLVQEQAVKSTWGGPLKQSPLFDEDFQIPGEQKMTHFSFYHGLGDCSNAAHLLALYTQAGHPIAVECSPDKAPLFQAAGCEIKHRAGRGHPWAHPPGAGAPQHDDHWAGNKTAWNISRGGLPDIGSYEERWHDLCNVKLSLDAFVPDDVRQSVQAYVDTLPRPVVLLHTKGNTSPDKKNYPDHLHQGLYSEILERLGGCVVLLDWDSRVPWFHHYGVRHVKVDWHTPNVLELYELIRRADCLVGVDSGVLHFGRFTDTPAVGIWTHHYPSHFAIPRLNTAHVLGDRWQDWTRRRRLAFNLIDVPGEVPAPWEVAEVVARMVRPPKYLARRGPDVLLQHLLDRLRQSSSYHPYLDRHRTMSAFLKIVKGIEKPVVVETGCIRAEDDWTAGFSSFLFGWFLKHHGGELHSVDIDGGNVNFARTWTQGLPVTVHQSDSRLWLANYNGKIDALYLDSADVDTPRYQEICLEEAQAAISKLSDNCPILIDDTTYSGGGKYKGKGGMAIPWLLDRGWKVALAGYQVLLVPASSASREESFVPLQPSITTLA